MTSEEIKEEKNKGVCTANGGYWLAEIAYQLAVMNERAELEIERAEKLADFKAAIGAK